MKKICTIFLLLSILLTLATTVAAENPVTDASVARGCHSVDAAQTLSQEGKLLDTSKAVILYDRKSGSLIYTYNADARIYPSSMVKIMTALVVLEHRQPSDEITITDKLYQLANKDKLKPGEVITVEALLNSFMVSSGNDACVALAVDISGSVDGFVALMNAKAAELGCTDTHFTNPHGLHHEDNYTTARDVCRMLDYALQDPVFARMFGAESYTIPETNKNPERVIYTSNHMISEHTKSGYLDKRVTGGKYGFTNEAGRCLAVTAEVGGMELIAIVMGAKAVYEEDQISLKTYGCFEEMKKLLDYAQGNFAYKQIFYENQVLLQYPVSGGSSNVAVMPALALATVLPKDFDETLLRWEYGPQPTLAAPVEQGQVVNSVQVWYGNICVSQTELVAMHSVSRWSAPVVPDVEHRLAEDAEGKRLTNILIGVAAVVATAAAAVIGFRLIRIVYYSVKEKQIEKRKEKRRSE